MATNRQRIADRELEERLGYIGAGLIEGPKACGKTATATQHAKTVFRFDEDETARSFVGLSPEHLFDNPIRRRRQALRRGTLLGNADAPP